jgi:predicted phage-related endonuclease
MTQQPQMPPIEAPPAQVKPRKNSKLEQLHALYALHKAKADAAAAELKAVTDAIKVELTKAAPDQERITLASQYGPTLNLTYVVSWRVDSKRLKAEQPATYQAYAKQSSTWRLEPARGEG